MAIYFEAFRAHVGSSVISFIVILYCSFPSLIEVRDSRTGYLVPVGDGPGLLPDWESCWDATLAVAAAVTWKLKLTFWPGNYIWSLQIGF